MALQEIIVKPDHVRRAFSMISLSFATTGQTLSVVDIRGGRKLKGRLRDMGLNPGSEVTVIKNDGFGPLIIAVKEDSRLVIGRGMAGHILVSIPN